MRDSRLPGKVRAIILFVLAALLLTANGQTVLAKTAVQKYTVKLTAGTKKIQKTILTGEKLQLTVKNGNKKLAVNKVSFSSSKKNVVSVSKKGILTAKKAGKAVITVKYKKKKAKIAVTVLTVPSVGTVNEKTIKNYLLEAMMPVGKVLYVWGGGWNNSTTKGITTTMKNWYKNQSRSYNYENYSDLSATNRAKGFDCSGYIGWCAYQVMHSRSGEGSGYTVTSGDIGSSYESLEWGSLIDQKYLSSNGYVLKPGDIGYNGGHCFIVVGQCRDKSVVILHSQPQAGVQLSGTTTPDGDYKSEAVALAKKYMSRYNTSKYEYCRSVGNYIRQYNYFRWNRQTLADPDGYMSKYANQILIDLFG